MPRSPEARPPQDVSPGGKGSFTGGDIQPGVRRVTSPDTGTGQGLLAGQRTATGKEAGTPVIPLEQKVRLLRQEYARHGGNELIADVQIGPDGKPVYSVALICGSDGPGLDQMAADILWYLDDNKVAERLKASGKKR